LAPATQANAALVVQDLDRGATPDGMAQLLAGEGVSISNVTYAGATRAGGIFGGGSDSIGFESGIILDSGNVQTVDGDPPCSRGVEGPNNCYEGGGPDGSANSTSLGTPGDPDLTALAGFATFDATILEFDFVPQASAAQFSYVFSSDEYNDFSNSSFNDVFAFFVNGANCAVVPGTGEPVSINTINNGRPGGDGTPHNPELFRDNVRPSPSIDTQMDGLTTVLTCNSDVNAGQTNHMKLAIADASDRSLDSAVFLQQGSLVSPAPPPPNPGPYAEGFCANLILGSGAKDNLTGTAGSDLIKGRGGSDKLNGGAGDDCVRGASGRDKVRGGDGNDRLNGGPGHDRISGGSGDDLIKVRAGRSDRVRCGAGKDTVIARGQDRIAKDCEKIKD